MALFNRLSALVPDFRGVRMGPATAGDRGRPSTDEKVPSSWTAGVGGRVWFLPYADNTSTGDSPEIRAAMRLMLRDPWIKAAWFSQVLTVLSQDFQIHHPNSRTDSRAQDGCDFVRHCIESADGGLLGLGLAILMNLGSDGFSLAEKVWTTEERHPKYKGRTRLRALKPKDASFGGGGAAVQLVGDQYRNVTGVKVLRTSDEFPISDFTYVRYLHCFDEPFGMAAFRASYGDYWMRDTVRKLRVIRIEKADGLLVGEYEDPADKGPLEAMLARAKISTWASIPAGVKVSAIDKSKAAEPDFKSFDESLRESMISGISFASLHILQGNVADGRGDTKVHKAVSDLGPWLLTALAQEVINRQIIPDLLDYNVAGLMVYPRLTIGGVTNQEILEQLDVLEKAQARGFNPSRHHYATASTIQEADPQDPTDQLVPPPVASPFGTPGAVPGATPPGPQPPDDPLGNPAPFTEPPKPPAPVRTFADAWAPFTGPKGGQGWKNGSTGEVRYQKGKPSGGEKTDRPAEPPPAAPSPDAPPAAAPPAADAGQHAAGLYHRAASLTHEEAAAVPAAFAALSKDQLTAAAKAMDFLPEPGMSKAKLAAALAERVIDRRGAAIRRGLIDRPKPPATAQPAATDTPPPTVYRPGGAGAARPIFGGDDYATMPPHMQKATRLATALAGGDVEAVRREYATDPRAAAADPATLYHAAAKDVMDTAGAQYTTDYFRQFHPGIQGDTASMVGRQVLQNGIVGTARRRQKELAAVAPPVGGPAGGEAFPVKPAEPTPRPTEPLPVAKPPKFKDAADAETHFDGTYQTTIRKGKLDDAEFVAAASHIAGEYDRLRGMKAAAAALKKRKSRNQTLELGRDFGDNTAGVYQYGEGIELRGERVDPKVAPSFGGHTVGTDLGTTFRHEFGHDVYHTGLTGAKQREWNAKFQKYVGTATVSRYGGTNTSELFAESFAAYTSPRYKRGSLPADIETWLDANVRG